MAYGWQVVSGTPADYRMVRRAFNTEAMSLATGDSKLIDCSVRGCKNVSCQAWSICRRTVPTTFCVCLEGKSFHPLFLPYVASPTTGWPMAAQWTRTWWVRPVFKSISRRVTPEKASLIFHRVLVDRLRRLSVDIFFRSVG